jgi:hypothetical protein
MPVAQLLLVAITLGTLVLHASRIFCSASRGTSAAASRKCSAARADGPMAPELRGSDGAACRFRA